MKKQTSVRNEVLKKHDGHCGYCGCDIDIKSMQVDHIIPKSFFVTHVRNKRKIPEFLQHLTENDVDHIDNLMPSCRVCNKWKSAHSIDLFRSEIEEQINRLNKYNANYRLAKMYGMVQEKPTKILFYYEKNLR